MLPVLRKLPPKADNTGVFTIAGIRNATSDGIEKNEMSLIFSLYALNE